LRTLNWPQATFDTTKGALIVEASWYEDDLNLYSLHQIFTQPRFEKWGETELSKFMGYVKEQEQWSNLDSREYEDWGLNLFSKYTTEEGMKRTLNVFSRDGDDSLYTNSSTDFAQEMLTNLETVLSEFWEGEWELSFWFSDPTYEVRVKKFGEGMCNA
jgi:hypothetical protein